MCQEFITFASLKDIIMEKVRFAKLLLLAVLVFSSVGLSAQGHLLFDGIPIDGSYSSFLKKLQTARYKYVKENEETSVPVLWGKSKDIGGYDVGVTVFYKPDETKLVTGVSAIHYEKDKKWLSLKADGVRDYLRKTYPSATFTETRYLYDETPEFGSTDRECVITVPGKGTITVSEGTDMDDNLALTVYYHDALNNFGRRSKDAFLTSYDLSPFVSCAIGCTLDERESSLEIRGKYNGRSFVIEPVDKDCQLLRELMAYNNNKDVKASLLNAYVYSVVRNNLPANTHMVTSQRMEKVIYAYVDAQRKMQQQTQGRVSVRGALWGMLKNYLYTSQEKAMMDRTIPKDVQEKLFVGILGAVGGNGPTNFDMLSPSQQAVIHESSNAK